jgi:hypothetical protein
MSWANFAASNRSRMRLMRLTRSAGTSVAMSRRRFGDTDRWRVRNTWSQRHVRTSAIVVPDPRPQDSPQIGFGKRDQPVQALAADRTGRRYPNAQFQQQLIGDALLAPQRFLTRHAPNQRLHLRRNRWPTRAGLQAPQQSPSPAVPADQRLRPNDHQCVPLVEHTRQ